MKTTEGAAEYPGVAAKTLENWRSLGRGPRYVKLGHRVVYRDTELAAFVDRNVRQSTAERPKPARRPRR